MWPSVPRSWTTSCECYSTRVWFGIGGSGSYCRQAWRATFEEYISTASPWVGLWIRTDPLPLSKMGSIKSFDVESLIEELTLEEKVALTAGTNRSLHVVSWRKDSLLTLILIRKGFLAHSRYSAAWYTFHTPLRWSKWSPRNQVLWWRACSLLALRYRNRGYV